MSIPRPRPLPLFSLLSLVISPWSAVVRSDELTETRFRQLHQQLEPSPDEPWRTIPWKTSLLDAQQAAVKEKKPIFIWAMDGHPLGCT